MDILIAAAGSIGSIVGALLAPNHNVTLLRRSMILQGKDKVRLKVFGGFETSAEVTICNWENLEGSFEMVYLACQGQDTKTVIEQIKSHRSPILNDFTPIISLQNGVANGEIIRDLLPNNPVILASLWWGGTLLDPVTVFYNRVGKTWLGITKAERENQRYMEALYTVYDLLSSLPDNSFDCAISDAIEDILYQKLALNILAPAAALVKSSNYLHNPYVRKIAHQMLDEATMVIKQQGYRSDDLLNLHKFLASPTDASQMPPETPWKSSTQISAEKYGGMGSNVDVLLGELGRLAKGVNVQISAISLVKSIVETFPPDYSPLPDSELRKMLNAIEEPKCNLTNNE